MQAGLAGEGVVLASIASALINLPLIYRTAKNRPLSQRITALTLILVAIGIALLAFQESFSSRHS
jgi:hypothetical protein